MNTNTTTDPNTDNAVIHFRVDPDLRRQIEAIARRDYSTISATFKRLAARGLRAELQESAGRG